MTKIYSVNGNETRPIGRVEDDGWVYDAIEDGESIGIVDQYGAVYDDVLAGEFVGIVFRDGLVVDEAEISNTVGHVDENGMVCDADGQVVARAEGEPKYYAGVALLLMKDKLAE